MNNPFTLPWQNLEQGKAPAKYLRSVITLDYKTFANRVNEANEKTAQEIAESLYAGDAYLLKNTFAPAQLKALKERTFSYGKTIAEGDFKILDGCPDSHQKSDFNLVRPKNGYMAVDHSYYFFRWNKDPLSVFRFVQDWWRMVKWMSGHPREQYEHNLPSDYAIDKIQIIHYPPGAGQISTHSDPFSKQKAVLGATLTERGKDYNSGGFYILRNPKSKEMLDEQITLGTSVLFHPSLFHGVETIDKNKPADWETSDGRWFLSAFTVDSHHVKVRENSLSPEQRQEKDSQNAQNA